MARRGRDRTGKDEDVPSGTTPSYDGEEPQKKADAEFTYSFAGWTPDVEEVSSDTIYTATYTSVPITSGTYYTISFDSNGGSDIEDIRVMGGDVLAKPDKPTKRGYTFKGWYDKDLEEEYDFDSAVTSDFTLYAKWKKKAPVAEVAEASPTIR